MSLYRSLLAILPLALLPAPAHAETPGTLTCVETHAVNWQVDAPVLITAEPRAEFGPASIHLNPTSGIWYFSVAGSAALTQGGGTFAVHEPGFSAWYDEWVGLDGTAVLRIRGNTEPFRFILLSDREGLLMGTCTEPETPFIFLDRP